MLLCILRKLTGRSYQEIGEFFGGRDHSSVLYGINKVERLRVSDEAFDLVLTTLTDELDTL